MSTILPATSNMDRIKEAQAMMQSSARQIAGMGTQSDESVITNMPVESPFRDPVQGAHHRLLGKRTPDMANSMVNMILASRSFEANVSAVKALHDMARQTTKL